MRWNLKPEGLVVTLAGLLIAAAYSLATPRSILGIGYIADSALLYALVLLGFLALIPAQPRLAPEAKIWRWGVILFLALPFAKGVTFTMVLFTAIACACGWLKGEGIKQLGARGATLAGLLAVAGATASIYSHVDARVRAVPGASAVLEWIFRFLGMDAHRWEEMVVAKVQGDSQPILPSLDKFGGEFSAILLTTIVAGGILFGFPLKRVLGAGLVILSTAAVRAGATMGVQAGLVPTNWWSTYDLLISFLPILFFVPIALGRFRSPQASPLLPTRKAVYAGGQVAFATLGLVLLLVGWYWRPMGETSPGKIVLDEAHSDWEQSDVPIDTEYYGTRTVYNYYNLSEALAHYYDVQLNHEEITPELLKNASVLILKTPTRPYSPNERQAIAEYVRSGGGLWAIGDHTDAFGMDTYLNKVVGNYGFTFRADAVLDATYNRNLYNPSDYSDPALKNLPLFLFYTGDSLQTGWLDADTIQVPSVYLDDADYSAGTFFGKLKSTVDKKYGTVTAAAMTERDGGRVALWSDSTLFSNFSIFIPGKMEVALANVDWLSRRGKGSSTRFALLGIGAILCLAACLQPFSGRWILGFTMGAVLLPSALATIAKQRYPEPKLKKPFHTAYFVQPHKTKHLPIYTTVDQASPDSYLTAFIAAQRVGLRPYVSADIPQEEGKPIVYIPSGIPSETDTFDKLVRYAEAGGTVMILDGGNATRDALEPFGRRVGATLLDAPEIADPTGNYHSATGLDNQVLDREGLDCGSSRAPYMLKGGTPIFKGESGAVCAQYPVGKGLVVLSTTLSLFSDVGLGYVQDAPTDPQFNLSRHLYVWYRWADGARWTKAQPSKPKR